MDFDPVFTLYFTCHTCHQSQAVISSYVKNHEVKYRKYILIPLWRFFLRFYLPSLSIISINILNVVTENNQFVTSSLYFSTSNWGYFIYNSKIARSISSTIVDCMQAAIGWCVLLQLWMHIELIWNNTNTESSQLVNQIFLYFSVHLSANRMYFWSWAFSNRPWI